MHKKVAQLTSSGLSFYFLSCKCAGVISAPDKHSLKNYYNKNSESLKQCV